MLVRARWCVGVGLAGTQEKGRNGSDSDSAGSLMVHSFLGSYADAYAEENSSGIVEFSRGILPDRVREDEFWQGS